MKGTFILRTDYSAHYKTWQATVSLFSRLWDIDGSNLYFFLYGSWSAGLKIAKVDVIAILASGRTVVVKQSISSNSASSENF